MKTFLILSDSHGNLSALQKLKGIMGECDYIIHLGDYYHDTYSFSQEFCEKIYAVKGNCDGGGEDLVFEACGKKILLTHGDRYSVKTSLYKLTLKAKEIGADIVLFGHTHHSEITEIDGITFINPGTLSAYGDATYAYMVISGSKVIAKIVNIQ